MTKQILRLNKYKTLPTQIINFNLKKAGITSISNPSEATSAARLLKADTLIWVRGYSPDGEWTTFRADKVDLKTNVVFQANGYFRKNINMFRKQIARGALTALLEGQHYLSSNETPAMPESIKTGDRLRFRAHRNMATSKHWSFLVEIKVKGKAENLWLVESNAYTSKAHAERFLQKGAYIPCSIGGAPVACYGMANVYAWTKKRLKKGVNPPSKGGQVWGYVALRNSDIVELTSP
jgi:hypothetical protein